MMMPPPPTAHFVVAQPEVLFPVLATGFDGPPHPAQPHQRGQGLPVSLRTGTVRRTLTTLPVTLEFKDEKALRGFISERLFTARQTRFAEK